MNMAEQDNTRNQMSETPRPHHPAPEPDFDDGLVHDHGWACRERGAKAH